MANSVLAKMAVLISTNQAEFGKAMQANSNALKSFEASFNKVNSVLSSFGVGLSAVAVMGVLRDAVDTMKEFEKVMDTVKAITGATDKEFEALRESALRLGSTTRYTAKQVAELQVEYGRLGFTTQEILAAQKATLDLATATGEDLAKSADVAGSTIRGFGLSAAETGRVVDVMAESFNRSALGLENFSEAMKYVAPIAAQAGLSVEETTAMLGTLADAGIRGSMAGTSLRKIISDLGGESGTLAEKLKKLADKGLTGAQAMDEVGRTAYASLLILANNTQKTEQLTEALNNASGAGARAAEIMGDNLAGDIDKLSAAYDALFLNQSESVDIMRDLVKALTDVLRLVNENSSALASYLKLATIVPRTTARGISWLISLFGEANEALEDSEEKARAIASTVQAAFDSGNVEAYIKALDNNIYKEEIIAEIRKRQTEEIKKQAAALTPQVGLIQSLEDRIKAYEEKKKAAFSPKEIAILNGKIAELRTQLELLNSIDSAKALEQFKNANTEKGKQSLPGIDENIIPDTSQLVPDLTPQMEAIADSVDSMSVRYSEDIEGMIIANQLLEEQMQRTADTAVAISGVIGNAIGGALSGADTGVESLRRATIEIIDLFYKQALAAAIAKSIKDKGPLPVGLIAAGIGIAAVKALFSRNVGKAGGGGGGGSRASSSAADRPFTSNGGQGQDVRVTGQIVGRGQDLWVILDSYNKGNNFTKTQNG